VGPSGKREPIVSVPREPPVAAFNEGVGVFFSANLQKTVSFPVSFLLVAAATRSVPILHCRGSSRSPRMPPCLGPLSLTASHVFFMALIGAVRCSAWFLVLGRSVAGAAVLVRSVKLVHHRIEPGEANTCSWRLLSLPTRVLRAQHDAAEREPPSRSTCRLPGAGLVTRWFTSRRPFGDSVIFIVQTALRLSA
jgi:hypothetical protein